MEEMEMKIWLGALRQARNLNSWEPLCAFAGRVIGHADMDGQPRPYCPRCILTAYFSANQSRLENKFGLHPMFLHDRPEVFFQSPGVLLYKCHWLKSATNPWGVTVPGTEDEYYAMTENANSCPKRERNYAAEYIGLWCDRVIVWIKAELKRNNFCYKRIRLPF